MESFLSLETVIALVTLTTLEIVLGIDNIIFISILVGRLPELQRQKARFIGLLLAMLTRILLLFSLSWVIGLVDPLFSLFSRPVSGRDLILISGGLFLLYKSTHEIHTSLEGEEKEENRLPATASFNAILAQIAILDIVFSLDSVITAVGLVRQLWVMITAVILAVGVMIFSAKGIGEFVDRHPTFKILALSFLMLIGVTLIADGFGAHIPKGYIYFSMAFAVGVELINMRIRSKTPPVHLRKEMS